MVRSRGWPVVPVVAILLVCSLLVPVLFAASTPSGGASAGTAEASLATQDFQADQTEFRVTVYENGSAEWVFRHKQNLESEQEREDFESFAEEFNENETELYTNFQTRAEALTDNGSEATGREMSAENFQRSARVGGGGINDNQGVVDMSFRWEGFAATSGDRVVVGDIFQGGLYLSEDQRLYVFSGPGLAFQGVDPEEDAQYSDDSPAESTYVTWGGEQSFIDSRPRIVLVPEEDATTPTDDAGAGPGTGPGWILPMGALFVVVLLGLGAAVAYRAGVFPPDDGAVAGDVDDGGGGAGDATTAAAGAATADADAVAGGGAGAAAGVPEEELISDEERVVTLLEDNGGRMKQVNIVDETGWSKSKVSMLLSDMEEEGTISKLRVGRENIVSLSGEEPDAAGSPFDDED